jgi:hypothetical protein
MTEPATSPPWTRRALVLASAALLAGGWVLLDAAGVPVPPMARHWPLFLIAGGLASIVDYAAVSRRPGALGRGVFALTAGIALYFPSLREVPWRRVGTWGPGLYLAIGLGCLAAWAASPRRPPTLVVVGALCTGLAVTFWGWGEIPVALYWGGLLVLLGVALVVSVLRQRRAG